MFEGEYSKKEKINRRIFILLIIKFLSFLILIMRIFWLQFFEYKKYDILSKKNRIRVIPILPIRAAIKDSNDRIIAKNRYSYRVLLDKKLVADWRNKLERLFEILETTQEARALIVAKTTPNTVSRPIMIFDNITWQELSKIEENLYNLEGIYIDQDIVRDYRFIPYMSHLIGYTGYKKTTEYDNRDLKEGIRGIEKAFDRQLKGNFGHKEIEVNAHGKFVRTLKIFESQKGKDLKLSIDANLQERIFKILPPNNSIIILSDVRNGKLKCLISKPSFDNSIFNHYISKKTWNNLLYDKNSPLLNRAIQSLYSPGSVFKIITILAALENGISEHFSHYCSGGPQLGKNFRCWNKNGHGVLDMESAIMRSCNHYIYALAEKIGPIPIISMAKKLRLNTLSGIEDLGGEVKSFIPTPEWKKNRYSTKWTVADTFNFCLGQGFVSLTPIMLNQLISIVVNDGKIILPSIEANSEPVIISTGIKKEYFIFLKKALFNVVNKQGGTAYRNRIVSPIKQMSGKTGTVQVVSKSSGNEDLNNATDYTKRNHSVFLGYYPSLEPTHAITVFLEHGGAGGNLAAEIAKNSFLMLSEESVSKDVQSF
jgi:penicillin-binding protein 2